MIVVYNNLIPFGNFLAMTVWPFIFVRRDVAEKMKRPSWLIEMITHEQIHCQQQKEMLAVGVVLAVVQWLIGCQWWSLLALPIFFVWYLLEWLIRTCLPGNAYHNISFEREAYGNQHDRDYPAHRKHFTFLKYLIK